MNGNEKEEINTIEERPESPLSSVFVNFTLEDDHKGEEWEWFKSRIYYDEIDKDKSVQEKRVERPSKKVEIITKADLERLEQKPGKFFLKLKETQTIWFLSLNTLLSEDNLSDAEKVRKANEEYKLKKTKKEIIRKRCTADAQTPRNMEKSQGTLTTEINVKDAAMFASEWDLYDIYKTFENDPLVSSSKNILKLPDIRKSEGSNEEQTCPEMSEEEQFKKIHDSLNFKYATLIAERLLASNCYQAEQTILKTKFTSKYEHEPTVYSYEITQLWSYNKNFKQQRLMVTDLDWNPLNEDLLAVSYGNYDFLKITTGLVCIWSSKNPKQPEREFFIEEAVTCLNYSKTKPNFLAVGTRRGKIFVVDVISQDGNIRMLRRDNSKPRPEPIWKVEWFLHKELVFETEKLLAIGESGILMLFPFSDDSDEERDLLKMDYILTLENYLNDKYTAKDFKSRRQCRLQFEELSYYKKTFSGLCFSILENGNYCYVSTKQGALIQCNLRNPSMTDEIFLAHDGPVYVVSHSPVSNLIYLTCGADWNIRIWMEGITQPLITLQSKGPVRCARWSPTIPTMIASIEDAKLNLWDLAWNIISPKSSKNFDDCEKPFSTILFSSNGRNIFIGGEDGLVRVVHLSELPKIPFLPVEALIKAIRDGLNKNKEMIRVFSRMLQRNKDQLKTKVEL